MILTPKDVQKLFELIQKNNTVFIASTLGSEYLLPNERDLLKKYKLNADKLYNISADKLLTSFQLGMLSQTVGLIEAKKWSYDQFMKYMGGSPLPLSSREEYVLRNIKNQVLSDIRGLNGKIFQDVNNILLESNRKNQEKFLRNEMAEGYNRKDSLRGIANEIASKTGDWSRNFDRIVEYNCNSCHQEGKAEQLIRDYGDDVLVWKRVFESACTHCIRLYLTAGLGSKPIIFKLTELRANGTNIGRKVAEWKPVVGSTHPFCRCQLNYYDSAYEWNEKTQLFDIQKEKYEPKVKRKSKVRITIGERQYEV